MLGSGRTNQIPVGSNGGSNRKQMPAGESSIRGHMQGNLVRNCGFSARSLLIWPSVAAPFKTTPVGRS